jgi:ferritin
VALTAPDEPRTDYRSVVEVFERALSQEQAVSQQIDTLYELAFHEKAFAAMAELQWFITEQVEEEKTVREIVAKLHMVENDPASLLDLDRELGARASANTSAGSTE